MKKITQKQKQYLIRRSRKSQAKRIRRRGNQKRNQRNQTPEKHFKPFKVSIWDGSIERTALCVRPPTTPPPHINFDQDIDATLDFLKLIRDKLGRKQSSGSSKFAWVKEKNGGLPRIGGFHDYSKIQSISVSAALIVASCYDRAKRITRNAPPAINIRDWPSNVFQVLYEVGFFGFIGHSGKSELGEVYRAKLDDNFKVMSAISGRNANGLAACSEEILSLLHFLQPTKNEVVDFLPEINTAVSEAMINVARHAYPRDYIFKSEYDTVGQWWMTARADRSLQQLKIVVYDQGATIPGTLPHRSWFKSTIEQVFRSFAPDFVYDETRRALDHEFINYSMKKGKTQTGERERGLGLPQMQALIDLCPGGTLTVVSRAGLYKYDKLAGVSKRALATELEGTLVEWNLLLPDGSRNG